MADFHFATADDLNNLGTPSERYKNNVAALKVLKSIEQSENTICTPDDLKTLSRYVGWGASDLINKAFPRGTHAYANPTPELTNLLTDDELRDLRSSSLTAFYTPLPVIAAIYETLEHLGLGKLPSLRILDPATGTGHFLGAMPAHLRRSADCVAVEIDSLSARIAKHLYPSVKLYQQGFEDTSFPLNFFDLSSATYLSAIFAFPTIRSKRGT